MTQPPGFPSAPPGFPGVAPPAFAAPPAFGAPAPVAVSPLNPLAGMSRDVHKAMYGKNPAASAFVDHLLLFIPTKLERNIPKPNASAGETQDRLTADVLLIAAPGGATGNLTFSWFDRTKNAMQSQAGFVDENGNVIAPFTHDPANGKFLVFKGYALYSGAIVDPLLICLDPARPDVTMVPGWIRMAESKAGRGYMKYDSPTDQEYAYCEQVVGAYFASLAVQPGAGQFG